MAIVRTQSRWFSSQTPNMPCPRRPIAVNSDESIETAVANVDEFKIEGMRHVWVDPKTIEPISSGVFPLIVVVSPKGDLDAACLPWELNLAKFLERYSVETAPPK